MALESDGLSDANTLVYVTPGFVHLLRRLLPAARSIHLVAREDCGKIRGLLHLFIRNGPWGAVVNSLPFFGSPGGPVVPDHDPWTQHALIQEYLQLIQEEKCVASTLITSPLMPDADRLRDWLQPDFIDTRLGLMTHLSGAGADRLMSLFHSKSRNMIRKALRGGFVLDRTASPEQWDFLARTHAENMARIQGPAHPVAFFELLRNQTPPVVSTRLYIAYHQEKPVAGLLLLLNQSGVEYAIPVIQDAYRSEQPLSFLIWHAMLEAMDDGFRWWNWGGTSSAQETLYRFKKRLGGVDCPYYYYVHLLDRSLLKRSRAELMNEYMFFYLYPFNAVENA